MNLIPHEYLHSEYKNLSVFNNAAYLATQCESSPS